MTEKDKNNIQSWKKEASKALIEGDFWKATACLLLADKIKEKYRMEEKEAIETVRKFNEENKFRDMGKLNNAIDMVIELAERYLDLC